MDTTTNQHDGGGRAAGDGDLLVGAGPIDNISPARRAPTPMPTTFAGPAKCRSGNSGAHLIASKSSPATPRKSRAARLPHNPTAPHALFLSPGRAGGMQSDIENGRAP